MRQRLIRQHQLNVAEGVNTRALRDDSLAHLMEPLPEYLPRIFSSPAGVTLTTSTLIAPEKVTVPQKMCTTSHCWRRSTDRTTSLTPCG